MTWGEACYSQYNTAAAKHAVTMRYEANTFVLLLDGYRVDEIALVGDPMEVHDWKSAVPVLDSWTKLTGVEGNAQTRYIAGGDLQMHSGAASLATFVATAHTWITTIGDKP